MEKAVIKKLSKETLWVLSGQAVAVLGSLALVRLLTEHLEASEYGKLALSLTLAALVNLTLMGSISQGVARYYSISIENKDLKGYVAASWRLIMYATLLVIFVSLFLSILLYFLGLQRWLPLSLLVLLFSIFSGYNSALTGIQNAARKRSVVAFHTGLDAWLKIFFAFGMIYFFGSNCLSVVIGYAIAAFLVSISNFYFLILLVRKQEMIENSSNGKDWEKKIWSFSWPFSVWGVFTWAQIASERWALERFSSTVEVGNYVVLYQLGYVPVILLITLILDLITPILYEKSGDASDSRRNQQVNQTIGKIIWSSMLFTFMGFSIALVMHEWLFQWLVAAEYRIVSKYFPYMVLAGGLFASGQILSVKMMSQIQTRKMIKVKIGSAVIGTAANIIGAYYFGLFGIVCALLIFASLFFIWTLIISTEKSLKKNKLPEVSF